ncbi:AIPR family protein [Leucobacter sp. gxy201]|uniref:AIPR family protein n=1 Tax=Leucobacter sp. gxy201 TaxID=2957200 RepID=UPI003D9FC7CD
MGANDVVLLEDMVERSRLETAGFNAAEQEAYFVSSNYLNKYRPSHDDVLSGIVDGTRDGGIDAIHIFANGYYLRDGVNAAALGRNPQLDLVLIQVKNTKGFGESAVEKLIIHLPKLLDFSRDDSALAKEFNPRLVEITRRFLNTYRAMDLPRLRISVAFAALKAEHIHPNVELKATQLEGTLKDCFGNCEPVVELLDAASIADLVRDKPPVTAELTLAENPISTDMTGGYVGLVKLYDYQKFITDETGQLDAALFDANVRDYDSGSEVNKSIEGTLGTQDNEVDFWWLNNGVTIVADRVQPAGKLLHLDSPQIVNGLQTSHEIYKKGSSSEYADDRGVLVKVIQAGDDLVKDRIIRATNSQTILGLSSLRATDRVQREIEEFLSIHGLSYERRKNFYRNRQIPLRKLVSIDQMGQAVLATLVQSPHISRGEVSRIFQDDIYRVVFSGTQPMNMYYSAIAIVRTCEEFLRARRDTGQVEDFVFHLSMAAAMAVTRKREPSAKDLASIGEMPSEEMLTRLMRVVQQAFTEAARETREVLFERLAKDARATKTLKAHMRRYLASSPRRRREPISS